MSEDIKNNEIKMSASVQSVERTLQLLELLAESGMNGLSIASLVQKSGLHKSTIHRLISTMISKGYVLKNNENKHYYLSLKTYEVGSKTVNAMDVLSIARPYLDELSQNMGEVSHLVIPEGKDVVYIYKADSYKNTFCMSSKTGIRVPMYCTGVGKAILSTMSDEDVLNVWNTRNESKRPTKNKIGNYSQFYDQIKNIRSCGYALDDEENEPGVRCVAAPIFDKSHRAIGAISISVPVMRMDNERFREMAQHIKYVAHSISMKLAK